MRARRTTWAGSVISGALLLAACGGTGETTSSQQPPPPTEVTVTDTVTTYQTPPQEPEATTSPEPAVLAELTPVNPETFFGQEAGSLAGYRFSSPSGNINCHIAEIPAACHLRDHAPWPVAEQRPDGLADVPSSTVGWMGQMDLTGKPMHWRQQGSFPALGVGGTLEYGQKITVQRRVGGIPSQLTCGSRFTGMTCVVNDGEHGFTVSRQDYRAW